MDLTWLTVAELADRLGRARSTIRLWRHQYRAWVPERRNAAGHQQFPLERLQEIAVLASKSLTPREISATLERRHGEAGADDGGETFEAAVLSRLDTIVAINRRVADVLERIADRLDPPKEP